MKPGQASPEQRALFTVLDEVRREPIPNRDWDRLEERLLEKIRTGAPAASLRRETSWLYLLVPVAAVAAAFAFFSMRAVPTAPSTPVLSSQTPVDGDALQPGDVLTTSAQPLSVVHQGRAQWILGPHARAVVLAHLEVIQIRLEAGALNADVVPSPEPERFVVDAAGLRVAVHGTRFSVELGADHSVVEVEEGVVSVQARSPTDAKAMLLRAPSREQFTLAGSFLKSGAAATARRVSKSRPPLKQPALPPSSQAPALVPEASEPLTIGDVEMGVTSVVEAVNGCFQSNTEQLSDMKISVRTSFTLEVARNGSVSSVIFNPPLSPSVQTCSEEAVRAVRFAVSSDGARVTRVLELVR